LFFPYTQAAEYNDGTAENYETAKEFEKKAFCCALIAYRVAIAFLAIFFTSSYAILIWLISVFASVLLPVAIGLLAIGIPAALAVEAHMKKKHLL